MIFIGCTKEKTGQDAILLWRGEYEADGCGIFLYINGKTYKPNNENEIGEEFKENSALNVTIDYKLPNKDIEYHCGDAPEPQKEKSIEIISIKMRLK